MVAVSSAAADKSKSARALNHAASLTKASSRSQARSSPSSVNLRDLSGVLATHVSLPYSVREGYTLDPCDSNDDCNDPRFCLDLGDNGSPCASSTGCRCAPFIFQVCAKSSMCVEGEVCGTFAENATNNPFCMSEAIVDASSELVEVNGGALSGEVCNSDEDCLVPRLCVFGDGACTPSEDCFCLPNPAQSCKSSSSCVPGEVCAKKDDLSPVCLSSSFVDVAPGWCKVELCEESTSTPVPAESDVPSPSPDSVSSPSPSPGVSPPSSSPESTPLSTDGLTFSRCRETSDCNGDRICYRYLPEVDGDEAVECGNEEVCFCWPPKGIVQRCASSATCTDEICAEAVDSDPKLIFCVSKKAEQELDFLKEVEEPSTPSPFPTSAGTLPPPEEEPCIDVRALRHMTPDELVYTNHATAKVLCDSKDSCATAAHIVIFEKKAIMMKTYCDIVGCVEKRMDVNSPRYKRGLLVESGTTGLKFTAFAARYGTVVEEAIISYVVRLGF